jgi:hypothetical protein
VFCVVEFNFICDKDLTVSYGYPSFLQLCGTKTGVCQKSLEVPRDYSVRFLVNNTFWTLWQTFDLVVVNY